MTISATYNPDLARVQLAVTSYPDSNIAIERSLNGLLWSTVRGGVQVAINGGAGLDDYEWADSLINYYRLVPEQAGLWVRATGEYASTPNTAALQITGDLDLRVEAVLDSTTPAATGTLIAKYGSTSDQRSYELKIDSAGKLVLQWSADGINILSATSTVSVPAADGTPMGYRATIDVNNGASGRTIRFYRALDWANWINVGTSVTQAGVTSIYAGTAPLGVGSRVSSTGNQLFGIVTRAEVRNGIDGPSAARADFRAQTGGVSSFVDETGLTWTITNGFLLGNQSTTITPTLNGKIWLKSIQHPFLNRWIHIHNFSDITRESRDGLFPVKGRSVPIGVHDLKGSPGFTLELMTRDFSDPTFDPVVEDRDLDLIFAAGDNMFIHIPAGSEVPGGYVSIGGVNRHRLSPGTGISRQYTVPCVVEAAPGPDVIGTTLTWGTVERLYGSWEQLLASNPTWADLLQDVGSPDDLVAL